MQKLILLALIAIVACKTTTEPLPAGDGPAVTPPSGSQFVYQYDGSDTSGSAVTLNETVSITNDSEDFAAVRISDTVGGISTTSIQHFTALADGDLRYNCGCDNFIYPIQTQKTYLVGGGAIQTPSKKNGVYFDGVERIELSYLGAEDVTAGGTTYPCAKILRSAILKPLDPTKHIAAMHYQTTFWYSSKLGYFVKEQQISDSGDPRDSYTRILVSHK